MNSELAVWRFAKLRSKYLIITVFIFAGDIAELEKLLYKGSKHLRQLIIANFNILKSLCNDTWLKSFLRNSVILKAEGRTKEAPYFLQ